MLRRKIYRRGISRNSSQARLFCVASAGDAAMLYMPESREVLEIADKTMEKTVFWGMIFAVVMVVLGMFKGMVG